MEKTRLGITVGLMGAMIYFTGLFSGYLVAVILAGYVLLCEGNVWLRCSAVKAVALMLFFSGLIVIVNLIPDAFGFISSVLSVFNFNFGFGFVSKIMSVINSGIDIAEKVLFLALGLKALHQGTIAIPALDRFVSRHIN